MTAFYNERDPKAAAWLRELIAQGQIAPGVVSEADIQDITPEQLHGFTQCHFFAGIGIWSLALRSAGWPDERPVWTGSCPCQPFSAAGKGAGFADERHLWPHWHWLIEQRSPAIVLGEQVASKDGLGWYDLVSADMEGAGYAIGAVDTCAAGFGLENVGFGESQTGQWLQRAIYHSSDPVIAGMLRDFADWAGAGNLGEGGDHIRQRLYFVGVADQPRRGQRKLRYAVEPRNRRHIDCGGDPVGCVADAMCGQCHGIADGEGCQRDRAATEWQQGDGGAGPSSNDGGVADDPHLGHKRRGDAWRRGTGPADSGDAGGVDNQQRDRRPSGRNRDHHSDDRQQLIAAVGNGGVADDNGDGLGTRWPAAAPARHGGAAVTNGCFGRLPDANGGDASAEWQQRGGQYRCQPQDSGDDGRTDSRPRLGARPDMDRSA